MRQLAWLLALCVLLAVSVAVLETAQRPVLKETAPQMLDATRLTRTAFDAIHDEKLKRGLAINPADDINDTGLIGDNYTDITTTLGSLEAKRSTTNPNIAAMLVEMFDALSLQPGDMVAINLSGSFPALNIATLCAAESLGLSYVSGFSVGASTYGATLPDFTYGDMEQHLVQTGILAKGSSFFSLGGEGDLGLEMPEALREEIALRLEGFGYDFLSTSDISEGIQARAAYYEGSGPVRCFVNVGGNLVSFGEGSSMHTVPGGILTSLPASEKGNGLVQHYLADGVPVIHLLNMKDLLLRYGLPFDPTPIPADGDSDIYWTRQSPPALRYIVLGIDCVAIGLFVWQGRRKRVR